MKRAFCLLALSSVIVFSATAQGALWNFEAFLDGLQETPPVATPGTGYGTGTLDDVTGIMSVSGTFQDLIAPANNAHVHGMAPPGTPAGVLFGLTFTAATSGTFSGDNSSSPFTPAQVADVLNELTYVNIHSSFRPGGEIRGQLLVVPEPSTFVLAAVGLISALAVRRRLAR